MSQVVPTGQETNSLMRWILLLAGPVVWSAHFLLSYLLVEGFCQMGWSFTFLRINGLSFILIAITILAVFATSLFAWKSYRTWKQINGAQSLRDEFRETSRWSEGPGEFMYFTGFLLGVLFTATTLMVGIPIFFLQPCP